MSEYTTKLYSKLDKLYVKQFMKVVDRKCNSIRKPKYSNEYYLYHIILVLTDLQKWVRYRRYQTLSQSELGIIKRNIWQQ